MEIFTPDEHDTEAGYTVITAANYDEAFAGISEIDFDLFFIDIILGITTGFYYVFSATGGDLYNSRLWVERNASKIFDSPQANLFRLCKTGKSGRAFENMALPRDKLQ